MEADEMLVQGKLSGIGLRTPVHAGLYCTYAQMTL